MGGNRIRMDTDLVADAMDRMTNAGQHMSTDWTTASTAVADLTAKLGRGDLGAAFLAGYQTPAAQASDTATRCCQTPSQLADKGTTSVNTYTSTDTATSDLIHSVAGTTTPLM